MAITPELSISPLPLPKTDLLPPAAAPTVWDIKNLNTSAPAEPQTAEAACAHSNEIMIGIDPDEIGEWDFVPTRAIVCLGCEAVRWS